jgi:alpha-N-arabinofuranosidase
MLQGSSDWDREVLATMVGYADLHSIHFYTMLGHDRIGAPGNDYEKNVFGPAVS